MVKRKPLACWPWLLFLSWIAVRPAPVQGSEHVDLPVRTLEHVPAAVFLSAGDLNGDGLCDLVLRQADGKTISIWYQKRGAPLGPRRNNLNKSPCLQTEIVQLIFVQRL